MKLSKPGIPEIKSKKTRNNLSNRYVILGALVVLLAGAFFAGALVHRAGYLGPTRLKAESIVETAVDTVEKNVTDELRMYQNNGLSTLIIDLKFKYYRQMLEKREEALRIGILQVSDEDFVPSIITLNDGPKMDVKMRLKGDWTDHLEGDKWSFRIQLKDDGQIMGFRQFSIQTPETRNFLYEWIFHQNLFEEDILTTRYDFVNVLLNGELLGVYGIEEHFTGELIESQGRRQGVIIRFDEDYLWNKWAHFYDNGAKFTGHGWSYTTEKTVDISTFQTGKIARDPALTAEAETARSLLYAFETGRLPASEVFDVRLMGRFFALSDLWAACHGTNWHNLRFYYNPITARLEPVAFDNIPFSCRQDSNKNLIFDPGNSIFNDDEIKRAYAEELYRVTRPGYIEELRKKYNSQAQAYTQALLVEYDEKDLGINWQRLIERRAFLDLWFTPPNPVKGAYTVNGINPGDTQPAVLNIELTNISPMPVDVIRFEVNGEPIQMSEIEPASLSSHKGSDIVPTHALYPIPLTDLSDWDDPESLPQIDAVVRFGGLLPEIKVKLNGVMTPAEMTLGPIPRSGGTEELLSAYPFISASPDGGQLLVSPGVWDIRGDLVVPNNVTLQISAGTVLRFEPGAVLLARGAVNLLGTASEPVLLTAQDEEMGWGGVVVLKAGKESLWRYARVELTHGIERQGWILTGGITFFESDITLDHAIIGNNQTEDAINVVQGSFTFIDTLFENTVADAFDSDFSTGEIRDCTFQNVQGDAVDVSGTTAELSSLTLLNIGDKGLSIGENSHIQAINIFMDTVGIGVASKDLSTIEIKDSEIQNARFAGLAAYIKKPVYGPAAIMAENVTIVNAFQPYLTQLGSTILVDGETMPEQDLDVDRLYAEGVLGN
ncbi:MAG: hypothetical protein R3307_02790 [Anaerolineales bacterium]|nr:hypothetical protein [Anaerolineales bacterium]